MSRPDARTREVAGQTAIATSTLYNPHSEIDTYMSKLAMKAIQTAVESGYAVVVADGGSPDGLLREFEGYGARLIVSPKGSVMGSSRRDAIRGAYETSRRVIGVEVNYTHPKKQRRQEDSDPQFYLRRLEQLDNVIHALHAHWLKLHPNQYK